MAGQVLEGDDDTALSDINVVPLTDVMASQPLRRSEPAGVRADLGSYWREGFAIVRGFLGAAEIENIGAAIDQLHAEGVRHGRCFRHGNLFYNLARGRGGETLEIGRAHV